MFTHQRRGFSSPTTGIEDSQTCITSHKRNGTLRSSETACETGIVSKAQYPDNEIVLLKNQSIAM